jgi:YVTN family beta-propeller protein
MASTVHLAGRGAVDTGQQRVNALQSRRSPPSRRGGSVGAGPATVIEFRILGSLEVVDDDHSVALGGPRQRALLAALLLHRRQPVSSDRLIDELWGERAPATARKIVQGYVSSLRKELGNGVLVSRGHGYLLEVEPDQTDVDRFESLAADGQRALTHDDPGRAADLLREALGLWRGPALAEFAYEPFARSEIGRLEDSRLAAVGGRIDAELALGRHEQLVPELEALARDHPTRERFTGQLMLALYRSGRQADALETYRSARTRLVDELGLKPGRQLQELERGILAQDPALDGSPRGRGPELPAGARRRGREGLLIAAGGAVMLAALAALVVVLTSSGGSTVRVAPNSLAAIDVRSDRVVGAAAVGARPGPVAFGSGSLWVANLDDQTVSRVDPHTLHTLGAVTLSAPPTGIATAGGGVWVATSGPTATFVSASRIDPQFDAIDHTVRIADVAAGSPAAIAARGSSLWIAPSSGELTALDPVTGRITTRLDPNTAPQRIDVGAGAVWATDSEADNVTRVDPTGVTSPLAVGHNPSGIAVGADAVWVADTGDNEVKRIDPSTSSVTMTIRVGHQPTGVAVGAGSVWVANSGDGTVTRIDPGSDKPIATIQVGGSPQQITVAGGRAWVTVDEQTIPAAGTLASTSTATVETPSDVGPLDPAVAGNSQVLYATCANLLNYPDKPGVEGSQLVPEVAQSLPTRSADGRSYTFTIRRGFRFSPPSDERVTAQTFKYSIERTLSPKLNSPFVPEFRDIVGASAYIARRSAHISGVVASGDTLTIQLTAPAPDFLARTAEPAFCAVPTNTPITPGLRAIPSAGPYRIASYTPGQGVVLTRNPNYHGNRPRRLAQIEISFGASAQRAIAQVEAGTADYATGSFNRAQAAALSARYGPGSPAAKAQHQQFFVNAFPQLDFFVLNTHRPLFADPRLRRAVSYAIDRAALARLGDFFQPAPELPTDHYLPPGMPGYRDVHIYPRTPNVARAKQLARGHLGATVILYTCDVSPCPEQAQIVTNNLAAIGLRVQVKKLPEEKLFAKLGTPGEPFDMAWNGWIPDYLDPGAMLDVLLEQGAVQPTLVDPAWRARLAAASRLTGAERYLTYARLDADLARDAAPLVAFGSLPGLDFFSARMGCQVFLPAYGIDLGALCIRHAHS